MQGKETLNKAFYKDIARHFLDFTDNITLPNIASTTSNDTLRIEFVLRLISRILFCKFLEKKGIVSDKLWDTTLSNNYYNEVLEPLFFLTLNTTIEKRNQNNAYELLPHDIKQLLNDIPYLNGGLFTPQENDYINILKIPNNLFDTFFSTLNQYHFTIDENNQNEQEIALDPEMLGLIFESFLGEMYADKETLRKSTGSYYTPREIVRYMVKSSLLEYLQTHIDIDVDALKDLIFNHTLNAITQNKASEIYDTLKSLKILDTACGSGAFPIGMLNELVELFKILESAINQTQNSTYDIKLYILQNIIHGIDVQPMATEIARLRCFLSLIIDENPNDIKPLPNLEFKFISANTLIPLPKDDKLEYDGYGNDMQGLKDLRKKTFEAHNKQDLERQYLALSRKIGKSMLLDTNNQIIEWNPFNPHSVAGFFDSEFMFGIKEFDIVIGNPPYGAKLSNSDKKVYKTIYKHTTDGNIDTYKLFIEQGYNQLKTNGVLSFIMPLSVTSSKSNTKLHKMLLENCKRIIASSYGDSPTRIFLNAKQKVSIISFIKTHTKCQELLTTGVNLRSSDTSIQSVIDNLSFVNSLAFIQDGAFCKIGSEIEANIMAKIYKQNQTLASLMRGDEKVFYRESGGRYYNLYTSYSTSGLSTEKVFYRTTGGGYYDIYTSYATKSSKESCFYKTNAKMLVALMSSSLFWWFRNAYSNGRDSYTYEFERFRIPHFSDEIIKKLEILGDEYEKDIERNFDYSNGVKTYRIRKSKHIIDKIDRLICPLYDLDDKEIEFIINFLIKFRG